MQTLGLNLCMQAQIEWLGVGGMRWYSVLPGILSWIFSKRFPPDVVLIYCGGNNLGKRKSVELVTAMKDDMTYLHWRFPKLRIVYSAITQRRRWGSRQRAFPLKGIDRASKWRQTRRTRVLIIGSSYIRRAKERAMRTLGLNLCMQAQIEWLGVGGMKWYSVLPGILNWIFSKRFPPDVVLIYCGGNGLGKRKSVELVTAMKDDMTYLHWRFPKLRIVCSAITQRRRWGTQQHAFPPKGIDRARKWVNNAHVKWLTLCQQ
ncbi:hypothetical protein ACEWY4_001646 [Coilia grayii]|uniref:SGNH hydrolase-type esterase domain-containing protein n=1 Tax=Coilia grayii TaxID=363190 RepID=A0ABD1KTI4_9TELE